MTEKLRQSLSAVIDDEADAFELRRVLDELERDPELHALWDRYHLIGSVARGERVHLPDQVRERVWQALDGAAAGSDPVAPKVAEAAGAAPAAAGRWRASRYTGLAVAASVAFAVVLGFNTLDFGGDAGNGGAATVASTDPGSAEAFTTTMPDAADEAGAARVARAPSRGEVTAADLQRARAYMLHHAQHQALNQGGVMPFVKMAVYEGP